MKRFLKLVLVMLCCLLPGMALAANLPYALSVTPFAGGYVFEGNQHRQNQPVYGLALGYNFSEYWGVELTGSAVFDSFAVTPPLKSIPSQQEWDIYTVRGDLLYHFLPEKRFVPYLAVGGGVMFLDPGQGNTDHDVIVDYGAGFKYFLTDYLALRADVRHIFDISYRDSYKSQDFYNNLAYTGGFTFQFGGVRPASRPVEAEQPMKVVEAPSPAPAVVQPAPAPEPPAPPAPAPAAEPAKEEAPVMPQAETAVVPEGGVLVTGITVEQNAVAIAATDPIKSYKAFTMSKPSRLVIDIADAVSGVGTKRVPVHKFGITAVRLGLHPDHLRVVLDAEQEKLPPYRIVEIDKGLKVTFEQPPAPAHEAPAGQPAVTGAAAAAPAAGLMVTGVTVGQNGLEISATERIGAYKAFTLVKPPRLVIDIDNAANALGTKRVPVHNFGIAAARLGSHSGYLRIVLDAAREKLPSYRITETDRGLKVDLTTP